MKKYIVVFFLVLFSLLAIGEKTFAQTIAEQNMSLNNWKVSLVGKAFPASNVALKLTLAEKEQALQQNVLSRLNKDPKKNYLFSNVTAWKTNSTQSTIIATNIEKMATLYQTPNSIYYRNATLKQDIIYSLTWFYNNLYSAKVGKLNRNWYDLQIGTPISLVNTLVLMKPDISSTFLQNYLKAIDYFEPATATAKDVGTGANRLDKGFIVTIRGVLGGNQAKINMGTEMVKRVYTPVTSGDGFYADGSFIQHANTPYTTGYGAAVLARSADFYQLLSGTKSFSNLRSLPMMFTYLDTTYLPVLYKDEVLDMTRGRGVSLKAVSNQQIAQTMLYDMFTISQKNSNVAYRGKYANITKSSIISQSLHLDFYKNLTIPQAQTFQSILLNKKIPATYPNRTQNKMMASASQMVDIKPSYVAGISMFSKKISAFESIGGQNKLGFYTGTGALYLYNGDEALEGNYYPTVDMTSLAGTTTDHKTKPITSDNAKYLNTQAWSGGVSDQQNGSATMHYNMKNVTGSTLEARKSWFFLNGKIVALGAGITSKENLNTETIVENRKLFNTNLNTFVVGGQTINLGQTKNITTKWAYLNGAVPSQNIGYVFPTATNVTAYKKTKAGNWNTINTRNRNEIVSANYAGITISHGKKPTNKSYSYIILPGKSKQATEAYSKKIDIEIRANNLNQQAVFDKSQNLWIANFRQASTLNGIVAQTRGSIMIRKSATLQKITLADPSMEQSKIVFLVPKVNGHKVKSKSPEVSVTTSGKNWRIQVNTAAKNGKSFSVNFGK
ncbi:polysaccharide lyase 8 family protein [Listeria newyorkensis]|uniref:Polysaccharide lyase 8 family protein n=1 Tax=Listeria newyorkensis TaxID=1497681 RepID=A0A841YXJ6_9LIST|nr:polysaccharide lyase 8 family protein [Listeria newyorkensis]MBC1457296.1 polysaccharide lyase 8 family protein [Listeria newyorkensis]